MFSYRRTLGGTSCNKKKKKEKEKEGCLLSATCEKQHLDGISGIVWSCDSCHLTGVISSSLASETFPRLPLNVSACRALPVFTVLEAFPPELATRCAR